MKVIMGRRATGRTERLLVAAAALQLRHDEFVVVFVAPTHRRAHYLSTRVFELIEGWQGMTAAPVLDPSRTIVDSAQGLGSRLRGSATVTALTEHTPGNPSPSHKVFAFIDDADALGQVAYDQLMDDLTRAGVAVSAVVFTSNV